MLFRSPESINLCTSCFQEIGRGKSHTCNNVKNNLIKIFEKLPEKSQEQLLSCIVQKKIDSDPTLDGKSQNIDLNILTAGRVKRMTINPVLNKNVLFDEESLDNLIGASSSEMKKVTNFLRCHVGRKSIPVAYSKHMTDMSNLLKDVYKTGEYEFECAKSANKALRPVVYADAEELLDVVIEKRNLQGNVTVNVMADGGQGFFKISLTILPENYSPVEDSCLQDTYNNDNF